MTSVEEILFVASVAMVVVWLACVGWLVGMLRERHPAKYQEMDLEHTWPRDLGGWLRGFDNSRAVKALLRFLWKREYSRMGDEAVARLGGFMRGWLAACLAIFALSAGSILWESRRDHDAAMAGGSADDRRAQAYRLHNERRWAEAVAIYDELLGVSGADAELVYWRGMARWHLRRDNEALVDFRRVMDLDPGKFEAYLNADRILSQQRRFDDCVDLWTRFLRVVPGHAEAHLERGGSHYHRGDRAAALADTKRACELGNAKACGFAQRLEGGT